jgi:hypothetical protein
MNNKNEETKRKCYHGHVVRLRKQANDVAAAAAAVSHGSGVGGVDVKRADGVGCGVEQGDGRSFVQPGQLGNHAVRLETEREG